MRAVVYDRTGGPDVLRLIDKPLAGPGPGEVRVKIVRSGVNPTDWKSRAGALGQSVEAPQTPNQDGAGIVDAVGEGVEAALLGLRVWVWEAAHGRPEGTAQEYAVVPRAQVVTLPDPASFDVGASLGVPFITAHRCLTVGEEGPTRLGPGALAGRTVLVTGGAGAVGNAAIQLARWSDATILTTVSSPAKALLARAAGADHVIDYRSAGLDGVAAEVLRIVPDGVDTIVEVAAAGNAGLDPVVAAQGGTVSLYAGTPDDVAQVPVRASMARNVRYQYVYLYTVRAAAKLRAVDDITAAILDGAIRVGDDAGLPLHHYPLERSGEAHAAVEGAAVGKVLIDVT